jgi:hypothetical protein
MPNWGSLASGIWQKIFNPGSERATPAIFPAERAAYTMKNFNGSEWAVNEQGLIVQFRDAEGRQWRFVYRNYNIVQFSDPQEHTWRKEKNGWKLVSELPGQAITPQAVAAPIGIMVDHSSGEIIVQEASRTYIHRSDGTMVTQFDRMQSGKIVRMKRTEYATRPQRAVVVSEQLDGQEELVTSITCANGKLFDFEYDRHCQLVRYSDVTKEPGIVYDALRDRDGLITGWIGRSKDGSPVVFDAQPVLESVDVRGDRHFIGADGNKFIVKPSGTAYYPSAEEGYLSGCQQLMAP